MLLYLENIYAYNKLMGSLINKFFVWYNKYYLVNVSIAAFLFALQIIHLYWLAADVIAFKLFGESFFHLEGIWYYLILLVDYTEIPALISVSLVYINELRQKFNWKSALFIGLLLSQFLHIFWITDEFVVEQFVEGTKATVLPVWLAWVAILIDYGEVPVIIDTIKKVWDGVKKGNLKQAGNALKERD